MAPERILACPTVGITGEAHIDDAEPSWGIHYSALRLVHPLVLQLLRDLRQLARGPEDGCDLDCIEAAAVDNAVRPDDDLADFGVVQFWHHAPGLRKSLEPFHDRHDALDHERRIPWRILRNVPSDGLEILKRLG